MSGPSLNTARSKSSGVSEDSHEYTHAATPNAMSNPPNRLAGRRSHQ